MKLSEVIEALKGAIDRILSGAPAPQPVPVRVKDRRPRR